jgi:hypothetical protein
VLKQETLPDVGPGEKADTRKELTTYEEFHPFPFNQHKDLPFKEFDTFDQVITNSYICGLT